MRKLIFLCLLSLVTRQLISQSSTAMEARSISANHALLQKAIVGDWDEEITATLGAGAAPVKFTISCTNAISMGGRYIEGHHTGNGMGRVIEGKSVVSYNIAGKRFQATTWNNLGTGVVMLTGVWQDSTKTINLSGEVAGPMDGRPVKIRQLFTFISNDEHMIEHFETSGDKPEVKTVTYHLRRKKS